MANQPLIGPLKVSQYKQSQNNIGMGLLEQIMLVMIPEGRQRVGGSDAVKQTVPEFGSSHLESPTADCRQFDWWHYKMVGASRMKRSSTRQISDADEWTEVRWRAIMQDFVRQKASLLLVLYTL